MIWVDRVVEQIKKRGLKLEWVDDMKTPSGRVHVGALRGVVIHDLIYKSLFDHGVESKFTYVFDDHDPMDAIPSYLDQAKWKKYSGMQLYKIPSPQAGFKNFAEFYALEFQHVFEKINCHPEIIWASELYNSGQMNGVIKEILDNSDKVRQIYKEVTKKERPKDWYPFNPICEKCQKVGTTKVYQWDGRAVHYRCMEDLVVWAKGCGYNGKRTPYDGAGKLPWKVEWAAKWKVIGVTVEGAGKDHMSSGGSHDIASQVSTKILRYPIPFPVEYEWFTIEGKKMSSSKGIGVSAKEVADVLPTDLLRFLIVRAPIEAHLDFNPFGDTILNLFDDYDRCLNAYFDKQEGKIPEGKQGEVLTDFARIIELSQVRTLPQQRLFLPRFRTVVNIIKTNTDLLSFFEKQKGTSLTVDEKEILEEREIYAKVYLESYAQDGEKLEFVELLPKELKLSPDQTDFLRNLAAKLSSKQKTKEELQTLIFKTMKEGGYSANDAFKGFYQVTIGRDFGPRAADIIVKFGVKKVKNRLQEATRQ